MIDRIAAIEISYGRTIPLTNESSFGLIAMDPGGRGPTIVTDGHGDDGTPNSSTVWAADGKVIEMRVPWAMVGLSDPSSRAALVVSPDGGLSTAEVKRLGITVAIGSTGTETAGYTWEQWNAVTWNERPKAGLQEFVDAVAEVNEGG